MCATWCPRPARSTLTLLIGIPACERFDLTAKALYAVQNGLRIFCALLLAAGDERLLSLVRLIAEALKAGGDLRLGAVRVRIDAGSEPIGRPLEASLEIRLVHAGEGAAKLLRGDTLAGV